MNKLLLPAILFSCLCSSSAFSQVATIDITGGYNFAIAPEQLYVVNAGTSQAIVPYYYTHYGRVKRNSYGRGGNLAFNFNWYSKKDIGFGIKLNALFGSAFSHVTTVTITSTASKENYQYKDKGFSFQFIPHIAFRREFKVVSPVIEAGMIIGMAQITRQYRITSNLFSNVIDTKVREYGNALLGFYTSVGVSFNVSKRVKLNLAINCSVGSYSPAKWERTSFLVDGTNQMRALDEAARFGEYVQEMDITAVQPRNSPSRDLKYSAAFSNIGVSTGICFLIAKKKKEKKEPKVPNVVQPF